MERTKWLKYYRNSLADGDKKNISEQDIQKQGLFLDKLEKLDNKDLYCLQKNAGVDPEDDPIVNIHISPFYFAEIKTRGFGEGRKFYPFWFPAIINSSGNILPPMENENPLPFFCRSNVEPIVTDTNTPILTSIEDIDKKNAVNQLDYIDLSSYLRSLNSYFKDLTGDSWEKISLDGFITQQKWIIKPADISGMAKGIIALYDKLLENEEKLPLLDSSGRKRSRSRC